MTDNQREKISQRFRLIRKTIGKDQKTFASEAKIKQSQVSEIENNKRNITAAIILNLEDSFGVNRRWLETGEGEMFLANEELRQLEDEASDIDLIDNLKGRIFELEDQVRELKEDKATMRSYIMKLEEALHQYENKPKTGTN